MRPLRAEDYRDAARSLTANTLSPHRPDTATSEKKKSGSASSSGGGGGGLMRRRLANGLKDHYSLELERLHGWRGAKEARLRLKRWRPVQRLAALRIAGAFSCLDTLAAQHFHYRTVATLLTTPAMPAPARVTVDEFDRAARQETRREKEGSNSGVLSMAQLRLWHARRGTLHLFYIQYPSNAPR